MERLIRPRASLLLQLLLLLGVRDLGALRASLLSVATRGHAPIRTTGGGSFLHGGDVRMCMSDEEAAKRAWLAKQKLPVSKASDQSKPFGTHVKKVSTASPTPPNGRAREAKLTTRWQ